MAEANPGHSDRDAILQALLPGPSTVVLFGPGKARMAGTSSRPVNKVLRMRVPCSFYSQAASRDRGKRELLSEIFVKNSANLGVTSEVSIYQTNIYYVETVLADYI